MTSAGILHIAAALPIVAPLLACMTLALLCFAGVRPAERDVTRLVRGVMLVSCMAVLTLAWLTQGVEPIRLHYRSWYGSGHYRFDLELLVDKLSTSYLVTASFIASLVGYFSARYLHRDPGFCRFFIWFLTFVGGLALLVLASGFNLLVAGWELVGLSSVFLVGFYRQRSGPTNSSVQVFTAYRIGDVGLLGAAAVIHLWIGSDRLPVWGAEDAFPTSTMAVVGSFLVLWAAMGKSAQGPFAFWLPRAMEGPTPSSAIFYGALSVHAGAYLLLRMAPAWQHLWLVRGAIIVVGTGTALYGAFVGRTRTDVKSMLANASLAQVGLIFVEIGAGLYQLALWHMVGHSMVRTLQFLRAPSAIADWRMFRLSQRGSTTRAAKEGAWVPRTVVLWLYRQSLADLNLGSALHHYVVEPVLQLARLVDFSERELALALEKPGRSHQDTGEPIDHDVLAPLKAGDA